MTPEFYVKAQALHEEFQKRELHYLNIERKMNSNLLMKKDLNLPLQEYLQKINQREKETDTAYQSIMKQMEELDRRADVMSFKIEKLGILRSSVSNMLATNWTQKLDSGMASNLQINNSHNLPLVSKVLQSNLNSVSTQTENDIYCIKCNENILNNNQSSQLFKTILPSTMHFGLSNKESSPSPNLKYNPQSLSKDNNKEFKFLKDNLINADCRDINSENSKTEQMGQSLQEQSFCQMSADNTDISFQDGLQKNKVSVAVNPQNHQSKNETKSFLSESVINEKLNETLVVDVETIGSFVSKSDAESINEFDFLESDTNRPSKEGEKPSIEIVKLSDNHTSEKINKKPVSTEAKLQEFKTNSKLEEKKEKSFKSSTNPNIGDNKSETSDSISGYHSPNISVTSDSDSIYEKETPLTASAAYQALLGNTTLLKKTPQNVTESESEDEIENAFANAVQRTNVKKKSADKQKKEETPLEEKPVDKSNKMPSMNKSQSKLLKNTRKVLGLDTSSGSDIEMAVKPVLEKKIDEDSDEFYD